MKLLHDSGNKMVVTGITVKHKGESGVVVAVEQPRDGKARKGEATRYPRGAVWVRFGTIPKTTERAISPEDLSMHWGGKETESEHPVTAALKEARKANRSKTKEDKS